MPLLVIAIRCFVSLVFSSTPVCVARRCWLCSQVLLFSCYLSYYYLSRLKMVTGLLEFFSFQGSWWVVVVVVGVVTRCLFLLDKTNKQEQTGDSFCVCVS
jgi:hypothetical protein